MLDRVNEVLPDHDIQNDLCHDLPFVSPEPQAMEKVQERTGDQECSFLDNRNPEHSENL